MPGENSLHMCGGLSVTELGTLDARVSRATCLIRQELRFRLFLAWHLEVHTRALACTFFSLCTIRCERK